DLRAELKAEQKAKLPIELFSRDQQTQKLIQQNMVAIEQLAGVSTITEVSEDAARQAPTRGTARFDVRVIYEKKIDKATEVPRLKKELEKLEKQHASGKNRLNDGGFTAKAPPHVVEGLRKQIEETNLLIEKIKSGLKALE